MRYQISKDVHGQSWISLGADVPPIPIDKPTSRHKARFNRPRFTAYRADRAQWKECLTVFEAKRFCRGSVGIIHDLRPQRGRWVIRVIGPKGGTLGELLRGL